jgi:TolB protein
MGATPLTQTITNNIRNIWVMNADGTGSIPLTQFTAGIQTAEPAWSPDGTRIAYEAAPADLYANIFVVNADGSGTTQLTHYSPSSGIAAEPAWSPDGSKLAFISSGALDGSNAPTAQNIWVMNSDGSGAMPLTKLTGAPFAVLPFWSPDGNKIGFTSTRALDGSDAVNATDTGNIWVMNADGTDAEPLTRYTTTGPASGGGLGTWSPDGAKIAFRSNGALNGSDALNTNGIRNVWIMNSDGSGRRPITGYTAAGTDAQEVAWRP